METNSLAKNSIYNLLYRILNVVFPLLTSTYAAHVLLAKGIGTITSVQNIVSYFVIAAGLGLPNYGTRVIAEKRKFSSATNKTFSELFIINFCSTTVCLLAYYTLITIIPVFSDNHTLRIVIGLQIFFNYFNIDWVYQGLEEYAYITRRSFLIKCISLVLLLIMVRSENDYIKYALISVIGNVFNSLLNFLHLRKLKISFISKDLEIKKHIKPVLIMLSTTVAIELYTLLDTTMLTFMVPEENVAYYANSMKIVKLVITMVAAIGSVLLPRLSYYFANDEIEKCNSTVNKVLHVLIFIFLPCGIGIAVLSDLIMPVLFGKTFLDSIGTLQIASLLIYTLGFSNLFGTQILITFKAEKKLLICTIAGAITNILLNAILIPVYQQNGAAVASVISELLVTIVTFYYSCKYIKYRFDKRIIICSLLSTIIMTCIVFFTKKIPMPDMMKLFSAVCIGVASYIITNIALRNPEVKVVYDITKKTFL